MHHAYALRKKCACGGKCAECSRGTTLHRPAVDETLARSGEPLDARTRSLMESAFGRELTHVRVHTDEQAAESAEAIGARAYTVGSHVAFARSQYRPQSAEGRRLLAHELAHVVQQRSGRAAAGASDEGRDEQEADRAAARIAGGQNAGPVSASPPALRLQPALTDEEREEKAHIAELTCNIGALCGLHWGSKVVTRQRVDQAVAACFPSRPPSLTHPCLDLTLVAPGVVLAPSQPPGKGAAPAKPPASGGFPLQETVEKLTKFSFTWGPVKFNVTLPKEATITLPVKLRGALSIAMKWKAETSGAFSFSLSLDGVPSFGIQASTKYDVEKKTVTTGLMFTIVGDVCDINVPPSVYSNMKTAGEKLKAALENYAPPAAAPSDLDRAKDVGKAIGALFDAVQEVEKSKGKCRKGPTLQFGPTAEFSTDPQSGARPKIGLGLTLTF